MTDQLVQKHLLKGTRSFELVDDAVNIHIDMPFLDKKFTVVFDILDPEPVTRKDTLAFVSVVNREPLIELFIDKPDPDSFNAFVQRIRQRVLEEDYGKPNAASADRNVDPARLQESMDMLRTYLGDDSINTFMQTLEAMKADPGNRARFDEMHKAYNELGPMQGAVLAYAPYIGALLTGDIPDPGGPG